MKTLIVVYQMNPISSIQHAIQFPCDITGIEVRRSTGWIRRSTLPIEYQATIQGALVIQKLPNYKNFKFLWLEDSRRFRAGEYA